MTGRCSFCTEPADQVDTLVAGAGVFICNECVEVCTLVIATKPASGSAPRVPVWEQVDDQALLDHLPRIEAVRDQVDDDLRDWVEEARRRGLSWDRIGAALRHAAAVRLGTIRAGAPQRWVSPQITGRHGGGTMSEELANEPLHPLLARRWSPTMFDESYEARTAEVESLLEAARWAPSAGNSQPWAFITARRGDAVHTRLLRHLAASSARWAPTASILVVNLCHRYVEDTDWDFSEFSLYDLGQAVAHMTIQAQSLGLFARQFRAFDQLGIAAEFDVPKHWQVTTMSAFGRLPTAVGTQPPITTDSGRSRQRRAMSEVSWLTGERR